MTPAAPNSTPRRRSLFRLVLLGGLGGFVGIPALIQERPKHPAEDIVRGRFFVDIDEDVPFEPKVEVQKDAEDLKTDQRIFFWSQDQYRGVLDTEAVALLLQAGRGESLETRLSPESRKLLLEFLKTFDRELRELILIVDDENEATKKKLWETPERNILLRTRPFERDVNFKKLKKAIRETSGGKGAVWGDNHPEGAIQLIILWKEWPGLKRLHDRRNALIQARQRRVRTWIREEFTNRGMALFGA